MHPNIRSGSNPARDPEACLEEAVGLALAIDLEIDHAEVVAVAKARPAALFGKGVVERFAGFVKAHEIDVAIVDAALAPIQQRNLERAWACKVIDRTGLILVNRCRKRSSCSAPGSLDTSLSHAAGLIEIAACHA